MLLFFGSRLPVLNCVKLNTVIYDIICWACVFLGDRETDVAPSVFMYHHGDIVSTTVLSFRVNDAQGLVFVHCRTVCHVTVAKFILISR